MQGNFSVVVKCCHLLSVIVKCCHLLSVIVNKRRKTYFQICDAPRGSSTRKSRLTEQIIKVQVQTQLMAKYGEGSASALEVGGSKNQVFSLETKNSQFIALVSTFHRQKCPYHHHRSLLFKRSSLLWVVSQDKSDLENDFVSQNHTKWSNLATPQSTLDWID